MNDFAIHAVSKFYNSDATKDRAKELINELSSDERAMLLSIINNTPEASQIIKKTKDAANDISLPIHDGSSTSYFKALSYKLQQNQADPDVLASSKLTAKLLTITDNAPIAHEKDAERSDFGKTVMNVWRAIKDFFGTRISDEKLIMQMCQFTRKEALEGLTSARNKVMNDLQKPIAPNRLPSGVTPIQLVGSQVAVDLPAMSTEGLLRLARDSADFYDDLSQTLYKELSNPIQEKDFVDALISTRTDEEEQNLIYHFQDLCVAEMVKEEIFGNVNLPFSIKSLDFIAESVGYNFTERAENLVRQFLMSYFESQNQ